MEPTAPERPKDNKMGIEAEETRENNEKTMEQTMESNGKQWNILEHIAHTYRQIG